MSRVHEPIAPQLHGKEWPECRMVVGYEIDRNATNLHNLRGEINAHWLQEEVRQKEELKERIAYVDRFHEKCESLEEDNRAAADGLVKELGAITLRLGLLEGKVVNYATIAAFIVSIVTTLATLWMSKRI